MQVRRHTAEQLYLSLLALEAEHDEEDAEHSSKSQQGNSCTWLSLSGEVIDQALDCLLASTWDGTLADAKTARNGLAALLEVEVKSVVVAGGRVQAACAAGAMVVGRDEHASYQSLLNDAARGGGY
jgi:hypothetical protein